MYQSEHSHAVPERHCLPSIGDAHLRPSDVDTLLAALRKALTTPRAPLAMPQDTRQLTHAVEHMAGPTISEQGLGLESALSVFTSCLATQGVPTDHSGYLAYIGSSPTPSAVLMDGLLSATGMIGSGWMGGAGLIWAENQVLKWLADLAGMPESAGGCFVAGGTAGNFSALAAARQRFRQQSTGGKGIILTAASAHSSVASSAALLDLTIVDVACDEAGRMTAAAVASVLAQLAAQDTLTEVVAIVAVAGSTNSGQIDDLHGIGRIARQHGIWFHVDAAYGGAFLCVPAMQPRFAGIELANSVIVDPHKGLFAPYDCCALLYAEPAGALSAFTQDAEYLEHINESDEWNPMHYAFHLSRRARGVPLWFSLAVHGSGAYTQSLTQILALTDTLRARIAEHPELTLIEASSLSVILFKRRGWSHQQYLAWADQCLADKIAFVVPSKWQGETVIRLCIMNTHLEAERCEALLASLG